ncbi:hypothetical protein SAMN02745166_03494 [Prosthecobacter debontii]|uniref:Uncharacterized protein n=1 Tax=Prosthecobacter debontii TaxID=48467 RepID=A0A1T4YJ90_9BACT|nr:hypothetical protein [Prosthecobacter debontii]SKB01884.1 hypothetical protein SAMN02745166_03494 [Prosthecobacter debontii]
MRVKSFFISCCLVAIWLSNFAYGEDFNITDITFQGENVIVKFPASQGFAYILQSSDDLVEWQDLQTVRWESASSQAALSQAYDGHTGKGFFRVTRFNFEGLKAYFNKQRIAGKAYAPGPSLVVIPSEHSLEAGVADSDGRSITNILPYCSINDSGQIAFLGETVGEDGQARRNIYQYSANSGAAPVAGMNVSSTFELPYNPDVMAAVTQDFGPPILDNSGNMYAWRRMTALVQYGFPIGPILPAPLTYLEGWSVTSPAYGRMPVSQLAMGNAGSGPAESGLLWLNPVSTGTLPSPYLGSSPWFAVHGVRDDAFPDVNNLGQATFIALGSGNNLVTTALTNFSQGVPVGETLPRPKIADNGSIVACVGSGNNRTLMLYSYDMSSSTALTGSNFSEVWPNCDISDDGRIVVFYGILNDDSETVALTPGAGVFAFVGDDPLTPDNVNDATLLRVAGVAGNGTLDPGETFSDINENGSLEQGEDIGLISAFTSTVESISVGNDGLVIFSTNGNTGAKAVFASIVSLSDAGYPVSSGLAQIATGSSVVVYDSTCNLGKFSIYVEDGMGKIVSGDVVHIDLLSDLNNDGRIDAADSFVNHASKSPGALPLARERGVEYMFTNDDVSNGAWDVEDYGGLNYVWGLDGYGKLPRPPSDHRDDDDAEAIEVKVSGNKGIVWFDHPAISGMDFFSAKECKPSDRINITLDSPFSLSSGVLPEYIYIKVRPAYESEGNLRMFVGETVNKVWAELRLPLTVVDRFGAPKFFHAARDYIFENNTRLFLKDHGYPLGSNPTTVFRLCVMREEATKLIPIDAYASNKKGIVEVSASLPNSPTVLINGNQCFWEEGWDERNPLDLNQMRGNIATRCHGRLIRNSVMSPISSDNYDSTTKPAAGSVLAGPDPIPYGLSAGPDGVLGTVDDVPNVDAGTPGGKYVACNTSGWIFANGKAEGENAMGGLSTNYENADRADKEHQMIGYADGIEPGRGCVFTATEIRGVGHALIFKESASNSGVLPLASASDTAAIKLFILDSGAGSIALMHTDPSGVLRPGYIGRKSAIGIPYYVNNYLGFVSARARP